MGTVDASRVFTSSAPRAWPWKATITRRDAGCEQGLLDGRACLRQHNGGHTDAPNMKILHSVGRQIHRARASAVGIFGFCRIRGNLQSRGRLLSRRWQLLAALMVTVESLHMEISNNKLAVPGSGIETILDGSRFVRACLRKPVDRTPVWFLRQAGRYMQEYRDVRKHHTLVEICKQPELAAEVTITAAEKLGVDAAIIFADLLLPLEPMGLPFEFQAGEGPVVHHPVRTAEDVKALRTDRADELAYVARAIEKVAAHFRDRLGIIGFCGAPYTLASYMIEGGGSRNYIHTKQMMYRDTHCVAAAFGQAGHGA